MSSKGKLILLFQQNSNNSLNSLSNSSSCYTELTEIPVDTTLPLEQSDNNSQTSYQQSNYSSQHTDQSMQFHSEPVNLSNRIADSADLDIEQLQNKHNSNSEDSLTSPLKVTDNNNIDSSQDEDNIDLPTLKSLFTRKFLYLILGGQLLACFITGTGVFSQLLAQSNVNIPTAQSFANYFCLALFNIPLYLRYRSNSNNYQNLNINHNENNQLTPPRYISISWWKYLFLAICDVEGNYFLVKAYQYTTITSVQLLDCFTIPIVMLLSYCFLKTRYNKQHIFGAVACCIGLTLLIVTDLISKRYDDNNNDTDNSNTSSYPGYEQFIGDLLVLVGCFFYAISNIGQEYVVKEFDSMEFLSMIGLFGAIVSGIQMSILEHNHLATLNWNDSHTILYLLGFNACLLLLYVSTPLLLRHSSAIFLNLSFLTSDFWSILIAIFLFSASLHPLYFVAFFIIICGLIVYNLAAENNNSIKVILKAIKESCLSNA